MEFDLEFLIPFNDTVVKKNLYTSLEEFLTLPVAVKKGSAVAREVESGKTHQDGKTGVRYRLPEGKRAGDITGRGLRASGEEEVVLLSLANGYLCARGDTLVVSSFFEIFGDVGPFTGNILTGAPVRVHGGIMDGYSVESAKDIEVLGLVEASNVKAGRNLALKGGMVGAEHGKAEAGANLYAKFAQQACLEAEGSITVDGPVMNCDCSASKKMTLRGRASLVGGVARAREEVTAPVVGSEGALNTEIILGLNPFEARRKEERAAKLSEYRMELEEKKKEAAFASDNLGELVKRRPGDPLSDIFSMSEIVRSGEAGRLDAPQKDLFDQLGAALLGIIHLEDDLKSLEAEEAGEGEEDKPYPGAFLKVENIAHPGVKVTILGQSMTLTREYERVRFIIRDGEIAAVES